MTDIEIDLFVQAFLLPPPCGFTQSERTQILNWIKSPSWLECPPVANKSHLKFFTYAENKAS